MRKIDTRPNGARILIVTLTLAARTMLTRPAEAQVLYGSILGSVEDQSGALIPHAAIVMTNKATGLTRETTADDAGRYSILNVVPGTYDVKVSASGFRPLVREGVEVSINTVTRVDIDVISQAHELVNEGHVH